MNITILGPGAIGSLWACYLATAGHNVSVWQRDHKKKISLCLNGEASSPLHFSSNSIDDLKQCDLLLVTVKAWQVESALLPLLHHLAKETILLFMHNGMGALQPLEMQLSDYPVLLATTTHGAFKADSNSVQHTGKGATVIGQFNPLGGRCQFMVEVLNHALPEVSWSEDIKQSLWQKLAVNCAINPLTAIEDCSNGALANPEYQPLLQKICQEVSLVAKAESVLLPASVLQRTVSDVIMKTAMNHSSMQQDIHLRRKSEIDFITGYLLSRAKFHDIPVPENAVLYQKIKQLEGNA
ncbi:MAG: 2-dehydropantoate 2-reductase [Aliivibrio sp.]|uniref:2-dehydropantoate 2-reductase n=1 Tax=Aliivibrio sp. TaxID=1872443 RepID=UPI001A3D790A|nr:2-dehydropantoate 2-reductase [Aliivibrio sp.]